MNAKMNELLEKLDEAKHEKRSWYKHAFTIWSQSGTNHAEAVIEILDGEIEELEAEIISKYA